MSSPDPIRSPEHDHRPSFGVLVALVALVALMALTVLPSWAANTVYVASSDPTCGGNGAPGTSCFTTLQAGIDNAGPGASTINVLEGTYAGGDIGAMGSAIAGGPADLVIQGFGDGLKEIIPSVGDRGIWNGSVFAFAVTLRGLSVTSPDRDAIHLEDVGDVLLEDMIVDGAGVDGADIRNSGSVTLRDSSFDENGNDGVEISSGGSVTIERCTANDNFGTVFMAPGGDQLGHDGFNIEANGDVLIVDSEARRNGGEGFEIHPLLDEANSVFGVIGSVVIAGSHATDNGRRSGEIPPIGVTPNAILNDYPNTIQADGFQIESCTFDDTPGSGCTIGDVQITDSTAVNNTQEGFELRVLGDIVMERVTVENNGNLPSGQGIDVQFPEPNSFTGRNLVLRGNAGDGIDAKAETFVLLEDVLAQDNGKGIPEWFGYGTPDPGDEPPLVAIQDQGIELGGATATCRRCTAIDNGGSGIQFEGSTEIAIGESLFATGNNKTGIEMFADSSVTCTNCISNDNSEDGFHVESPSITFDGCEASGSVVEDGLDISSIEDGDQLSVNDCRFDDNFEQGLVFETTANATIDVSNVCAFNNRGGVEIHNNYGTNTLSAIHSIGNNRYGIRIDDQVGTAVTTVTGSNLEGNQRAGIYLRLSGVSVQAANNWWGDPTGPNDPVDNTNGMGDPIWDATNGGGSGTVLFAPPASSAFASLEQACSASSDGPPLGRADLAITNTDGRSTAVPGLDTIEYTIVASNTGTALADAVEVNDVFPAPLTCTYTSVPSGGAAGNTAAGSGDLMEMLSLPTGSSVTYTVSCTIDPDASGLITNTATIYSPLFDPVTANNTAIDQTILGASTIAVPTLGEWALILLAALLGVAAIVRLRLS